MTVILFAPYEHPWHVRAEREARRRNRRDAVGVALALTGGAMLLHGLWTGLRMPKRVRR